MILAVGTAVVAVGLVLAVAVLTGIGSHRRGTRLPLSVLAGVVFPVTWAAWYVEDEQPHHRAHHHHDRRT